VRELQIDGGAVTRLVKAMETEDVVVRRPDPLDNRFTLVALTERGYALADAAIAKSYIFEDMLTAGVSAEDLAALARGLGRLRENLRPLDVTDFCKRAARHSGDDRSADVARDG